MQTHKLVGRAAAMAWKYCFQVASLRRTQPADGTYLRPVCLWIDEYANFISPFDFIFASLCRSSAACMVTLAQNRELMLSVLKSDAMVDSLCANLSNKFFCQNIGATNAWASRLIGQQWTRVQGISANRSAGIDERAGLSAGINLHDELRPYVDEVAFTHLRRGGPANDLNVDCVVHMGGQLFDDGLPYKLVTFNQR